MFSLIESAAGTLGKPGIVMIAPQTTTMNSAPDDNLISLIGKAWPVGAPFKLGSVEKLYWVFATQIGNSPYPASSKLLSWSLIFVSATTSSAL